MTLMTWESAILMIPESIYDLKVENFENLRVFYLDDLIDYLVS